ncbi:unnamed protein product [Polarella glacialis]|uniref:Aldose 1-epimerase n=1 Tax=Polarella glacialis TaxID=89957 RepID=A0A813KRL1_POLGL|nr:unnamed protein product [Polarella glacialis]
MAFRCRTWFAALALSTAQMLACASDIGDAKGSIFAITDDEFGEGDETVHLKVLRNTRLGEYVEVAWDAGGRTEGLALRGPVTRKLQQVLLDHGRNASAARGNVGWKGDVLLPYANRVENGTYHLNGKVHHLERNEDRGSYGKEGIHGYLYKKTLQVLSSTENDHSATLLLGYDFDGTDPGYPFPLSVLLSYRLDDQGFTLTTTARHRGEAFLDRPLPLTASWHSYLKVEDISQAVLELDRCSQWNHISVPNDSNVNSSLIPTGHTSLFAGFSGRSQIGGSRDDPVYWDDEFKALASAQSCPELKVSVRESLSSKEAKVLWMDSNFRWVQVFTGTVRNFGEQGIAVEAMSGQADAFNNMEGLRLLQPGEVWQGSFGVRLEPYVARDNELILTTI